MEKVINYYKKIGQTPLDCIVETKKSNPKLASLPITYAGRLDPLAMGVLLLLVGEECEKKDEYLKLEKEYEVTILFGFATDTYDLMGLVSEIEEKELNILNTPQIIKNIIPNFIGQIKQKYPAYSSRTVLGKPLFLWAREGRLGEIEIPKHNVLIKKIIFVKEKNIKGKEIMKKIKKIIPQVRGDFRQDKIISLWQKVLSNKQNQIYKTITFKISCGSGVYVRVLAYEIGQALGVPSLALKIIRTKVGEYTIQK